MGDREQPGGEVIDSPKCAASGCEERAFPLRRYCSAHAEEDPDFASNFFRVYTRRQMNRSPECTKIGCKNLQLIDQAFCALHADGDLVLSPDDLACLLHYSLRYVLGRRSYAVAAFADLWVRHSPSISDNMRKLMLLEIKQAIAEAENLGRYVGDLPDHQIWAQIVQDAETE